MRRVRDRLWAKILAIFLLVAMAVTGAASVAGIALLAEYGGYDGDGTYLVYAGIRSRTATEMYDAVWRYYWMVETHGADDYDVQRLAEKYTEENSNFFFVIRDKDGKELLKNYYTPDYQYTAEKKYDRNEEKAHTVSYEGNLINHANPVDQSVRDRLEYVLPEILGISWGEYMDSITVYDGDYEYPDWAYAYPEMYYYAEDENGDILFLYGPDGEYWPVADRDVYGIDVTYDGNTDTTEVTYYKYENEPLFITGYIKSQLTADDEIKTIVGILQLLVRERYTIIALAVASAIMGLLLFAFLLYAAGHKKGVEGIYSTYPGKMPGDLHLGLLFLAGGLIYAICLELIFTGSTGLWIAGVSCVAFSWLLLFVAAAVTVSRRIKDRTIVTNTVIYKLGKWLWKLCLGLFYFCKAILKRLPMIWRVLAVFVGVSFVEFIGILLAASTWNPLANVLVLWFFEKLILLPVIGGVAMLLSRLKEGGKAIAAGDLTTKIDMRYMRGDLREHAQALNSIGDGMTRAVDEQMKSERLKTELITNVSHDIKTPLTSIVNYVDLLKKEEIQPEQARKYVEVLDRQSARLKKLTEDLVEASKASAGTISAILVKTNLYEIMSQAVGEYSERMEQLGLEPVVSCERDVSVMADGKLLWRVMDNLLGNVCKYAQPGTRVYLDVAQTPEKTVISVKNISRDKLNIGADELMERFVRGDRARNTEGSGLGLNIAQSLMKLQKGEFGLTVDGDLFKAELSFRRI